MLKLSDLAKFYSSKLNELGGEHPDRIKIEDTCADSPS